MFCIVIRSDKVLSHSSLYHFKPLQLLALRRLPGDIIKDEIGDPYPQAFFVQYRLTLQLLWLIQMCRKCSLSVTKRTYARDFLVLLRFRLIKLTQLLLQLLAQLAAKC